MKLLFVVRDASGWAGTERVLNLVANGLSERFPVTVLSLVRAGPGTGYAYSDRVNIHSLGVSGGPAGIVAANLGAASYIAKGGFDVVVVAGIGEIKFLLAALVRGGRRFIGWEHFNAARTHKRLNRKAAARFFDTIVTLTERDAADWRRLLLPRAKIAAIPNPVPEIPAVAAPLQAKRVLALGRLEEQKRFDLLIEAFSRFTVARPDWTLRIRGSGSARGRLVALARERGVADKVEILEPTRDIDAEYRGASIYAMSSAFEGFPMTLLEAKAYGLPCVSFDCPTGPAELIRDGVDGFLTPLFDVASLAERLGALADDRELRLRMGANGREDVARFSIGPILARWYDLLEER
ncbi:MAG: glycosyltransferase family 4 protein [Spirochaetaceae bacterium]|nr:glycosyltransferase family 4 protein [Spirochaetaceae bacterium]